MNTIEMIANVGGQKLSVGKCSSAQARILVKNNHAAWEDGKLLLSVSGLALARSNRERSDAIAGRPIELGGTITVPSEGQAPWSSDPTDLAEWYDESRPPESTLTPEEEEEAQRLQQLVEIRVAQAGGCTNNSTEARIATARPAPFDFEAVLASPAFKDEPEYTFKVYSKPGFHPAKFPRIAVVGGPGLLSS